MLNQIHVRSFKSLKDVTVDLGAVNVFVGANGSGKSNLLESVGILSAAAAGRVDDESLIRRGVRPGVPALYKSSFKNEKPRGSIRFSGYGENVDYQVELYNPKKDPGFGWSYKTEILRKGGERVAGRSPASNLNLDSKAGLIALESVRFEKGSEEAVFLKNLRDFAVYAPNTATLRGLVADPQLRAPVGLGGGGLPGAVQALIQLAGEDDFALDVIQDIFEMVDWAKAIQAGTVSDVPLSPTAASAKEHLIFVDRFMRTNENRLSGFDVSEGAMYLLFSAVLVVSPLSPNLFAIDNFDAGLNPRLVRHLMAQMCDWIVGLGDRQVMLTCHNPSVLDGMPLGDDRVRLFAVDRTNSGKTIVNRIMLDERVRGLSEKGWTLSRMWTGGMLGGVPNV